MPLTTKRLTVDGDIVKQPKNVEVIIGTPIQELLDFCGGLTAEPGKILYGGPMMGTCVADLSQPILKNNNAILAFSQERAKLPKASTASSAAAASTPAPWGWRPRTSWWPSTRAMWSCSTSCMPTCACPAAPAPLSAPPSGL